jgi:hypothetical protein
MEQKQVFSLRTPVTRVVLAVVIVAVGLSLAGCGSNKQMARIDESQIKLETMVEGNAQQISDIAARLNQSQQELQVVIENVQNDVAKVAVDVAAVADAQMKLHAAVQSSSQKATSEMAALEQNQNDMSASLGRAIAGVQSDTRKVAADVTAVTAEQAKLYDIVQENNVQMNNKVAAMEQTEQERQNTIGGMQTNIQTVAVSISALGEDVLKLQEILQNNIRELVSIADITSQKQIEFHQILKEDVQTLDESLASLKTSQNAMQSRIEDMQINAPDFSDVPATLDQLKASQIALQSRIEDMQNNAPDFNPVSAAIDQLRDQIEELSRNTTADDVDATEYDSPPQANSIE